MTRIEIVRGSLLDQDVEAIVNAANTSMRGGSGIDGAVHRAAGTELVQELMQKAPHGAKTGQVVVSGGHRTPFRYILHTPGPVWNGGSNGEEDLLRQCYVNAAVKAIELGVSSIGYCSISTGIYRFPLEKAAEIALTGVNTALEGSSIERAVFAMFGEEEFEVFRETHRRLSPSDG